MINLSRPIPCRAALALIVMVGLGGCQPEARGPQGKDNPAEHPAADSKGGKPMQFEVTSPAFQQNQPIPKKYTGEGEDVSPPINWKGLPEGTKELVLICDDPDAPTQEPWVHWVIYKIPASLGGLPEGVAKDARLKSPAGVLQGKNSWPNGQTIGYRGPMPPPGHGTHHYRFHVYALEANMVIEPGPDKKSVLSEIKDHVLGEGMLVGTYER
jgi:Raf kinase inhibitor-like YbhB/YbcL family protein